MSICVLFKAIGVCAQVDVLTNRYDAQRTGANLHETKLTAGNVNANRFGKLYSYPVDGGVYAQPLYVSGVTINGIRRNVLYVATMNDKVYAFDADSAASTPLWMRNLTNPPLVTAVPITDIVADNLNVVGNVDIQSTPVIDRSTGTLRTEECICPATTMRLLCTARCRRTSLSRLHRVPKSSHRAPRQPSPLR